MISVLPQLQRAIDTAAALFGAAAVALGAYAAHAADELARGRLQTAVDYLFVHVLALLVLRSLTTPLGTLVRMLMLLGCGLFSGTLIGAAVLGGPTAAAPFGGSLLILAWLLAAVVLWRRASLPLWSDPR